MPAISLPAIFAAFSLSLPPILLMVPKAVVVLLLAAALAAAYAVWRRDGRLPLPDRAISLCLLLFFVWGLATCAWTFEPGESLILLARLFALMLAGLLICAVAHRLSGGERRSVQRAGLVGFGLALLLVAVEGSLGQPIYGTFVEPDGKHSLLSAMNRGATGLAILVWPMTLLLRRGPLGRWALLLPVGLFVLLMPLESGSALLSLAIGGLLAAAAAWRPRLGRSLLTLLVVATVTLAPLIGQQLTGLHNGSDELLDVPSRHRLLIWSFAAERIAERPFFGWGFDSSDDLRGHIDVSYVEGIGRSMSTHPHNAVLQVWLELGAVGAVILLALLLLLVWRIDRLPANERWAAAASYGTAFMVALLSYGIWQNQWEATLFAAALVVILSRGGDAESAPAVPREPAQSPEME